jgi:hypothetical protein
MIIDIINQCNKGGLMSKEKEFLQRIEEILKVFVPTPKTDKLIILENYDLAPRMSDKETLKWEHELVTQVKKSDIKDIKGLYSLYRKYLASTIHSEYFLSSFDYRQNYIKPICNDCCGHGSIPENYGDDRHNGDYLEKFAELAGLGSWEQYAKGHETVNMTGTLESGFIFCQTCGGVGHLMILNINTQYMKYLLKQKDR